MKRSALILLLLSTLGSFASCKKEDGTPTCEIIPFNAFTLQQDRDLGLQVANQINADNRQYPILPESQNPEAYQMIRRITTNILNSGNVRYKTDFAWEVKIIRDNNTLNAFCTPGGYIYVYTGLIKFLDSEDDLAGVMGHEIAHADRRHSTKSMTTQYGLDAVLRIVTGGDSSLVTTIAANLGTLRYSRCHESEADAYSVEYLSGTPYKCNSAANFFQKLLNLNQTSGTPVFLSTHPGESDRVQQINSKAQTKGCNTTTSTSDQAAYQRIKNSL